MRTFTNKISQIILAGGLLAATVQLNAQCTVPSPVTASPNSICSGLTSSLNATSVGSSINWYTVPTCGIPIGTCASAANFTVAPVVTTTYYAEAFAPAVAGGSTQLNYTGCMQQIVIPAGVSQITVSAYGAQGGTSGYAGGLGGAVTGVLAVTPGQTLYISVGGQGSITAGGWNGGGNGGGSPASTFGGGGGGASDIRIGGTLLANRVMAAAGGGGSGGSTSYGATPGTGGGGALCAAPYGYGGAGGHGCSWGAAGGCAGGTAPSYGTGGGGGGTSSGAPTAGSGTGVYGTAGTAGQGGNGGNYSLRNGGGGGGGGYWGGAGGMSGSGGCNGGGGGGSTYCDNTQFTSITFTAGTQSGHGKVIILGISGGCVSVSRTAVTVTVTASPSITVNSGSICPGQSFTMVPLGALTYTFAGGGPVVTPTVTSTYTVTGTGPAGCPPPVPAISTVVVTSPPVITVNSGTVCAGNAFTMVPSGAVTYTYAGGGPVVTPTANASYSVTGSNAVGCISAAPAISNVTVVPKPVISVNSGSICQGQSFTLVPNGANTYTYTGGSPVVSPTVTSSYSVTGTSTNGCMSATPAVANVTVSPAPAITVNSGSICPGNTFTMVPSGANTYTYSSGSPLVSPVVNTNYTVTGTSTAGCISLTPAICSVFINPTPTITVNSGSICSGQSFTMSPGGALSYTYSGGGAVVSPTSSTSYSVTGTNSLGCVSPFAAISNVTVVPLPTLSVTGPGAMCLGQSITLTGNGAVTYSWSTGALTQSITVTPTASTVYSLTGTGLSGCGSGATLKNVTVNPNPTVSISASSTLHCKGSGTLQLTANGSDTYSWTTGALTTTAAVNPSVTTSYTVTGTNTLTGCYSSGTITIMVGPCTGIDEKTGNKTEYSLYPNPNNGEFVIEISNEAEAVIYNTLGQTVLVRKLSEGSNQIELKDIPNGIYYIQLKHAESTSTLKIIKE